MFLFSLLVVVNVLHLEAAGIGHVDEEIICPDVMPCKCSASPAGINIYCDAQLLTDGEHLKSLFSVEFPNNNTVHKFSLHGFNFSLPSDVFGGKSFHQMTFTCQKEDALHEPLIHVDAFNMVQVKDLSWVSCDMTRTDFSFLASLSVIEHLMFTSGQINEFLNFPHLPSLRKLSFYFTSLSAWYSPEKTPKLVEITLAGFGEEQINTLMQAVGSYRQLTRLELDANQLTSIPDQVRQLPNLKQLFFFANGIDILPNGTLHFHENVKLEYFLLNEPRLAKIEPAAFGGDFSRTSLHVISEQLTSFEEALFLPILLQMDNNPGYLYAGNSYDCDCNLAWLVRDNRHLLVDVIGQCSNGTDFQDLDPQGFIHCSNEKDNQL